MNCSTYSVTCKGDHWLAGFTKTSNEGKTVLLAEGATQEEASRAMAELMREHQTGKVTVTLNKDTANWLKGVMQNPLYNSHESNATAGLRKEVWEAL